MFTLTGDQIHHAFAYQNGVTTDLGTLGGKGSQAYGNNDLGMVTGLADTPENVGHAFLWVRNQMIDIHSLGVESFGYDVNNSAQVVGYYREEDNDKRAFLWSKGYMVDLGTFGGDEGDAWGINEKGQVAGYAFNAEGKDRAYLWTPDSPNAMTGSKVDLGVLPGGDESFAYNLNNKGDVVGASKITGGLFHAVLWSGGEMINLNSLLPQGSDWKFLNYAMAINDQGQITGYGFKQDNKLHAFLLTPEARTPGLPTARDRSALVQVSSALAPKPLADHVGATTAPTAPETIAPAPAPVAASKPATESTAVKVMTLAQRKAQRDSVFVSAFGKPLFAAF
jgi:probable HAF family extracellular repeat protein